MGDRRWTAARALVLGLAVACTRGAGPGAGAAAPAAPAGDFVERVIEAPETVSEEELLVRLHSGDPAVQIAALRVLHGRGAGIEATAALLAAEGTSALVRLNALAALVESKGPESERALAEFRARAGARERGWLRALERGAGR